jgi:hypothetical protein
MDGHECHSDNNHKCEVEMQQMNHQVVFEKTTRLQITQKFFLKRKLRVHTREPNANQNVHVKDKLHNLKRRMADFKQIKCGKQEENEGHQHQHVDNGLKSCHQQVNVLAVLAEFGTEFRQPVPTHHQHSQDMCTNYIHILKKKSTF